jgi:hypothetical protein
MSYQEQTDPISGFVLAGLAVVALVGVLAVVAVAFG